MMVKLIPRNTFWQALLSFPRLHVARRVTFCREDFSLIMPQRNWINSLLPDYAAHPY